jgi:hypothetical protein
MDHGPVDVVALTAGEPRFDGGVLAELERQAAAGTIRVPAPIVDEAFASLGTDLSGRLKRQDC